VAKESGLIPFDEARQRLRVTGHSHLGVRAIPIERIVGSVDRSKDFDRDFHARHGLSRSRLQSLRTAFPEGNWPAQDVIEGRLIQIGLRALELGNDVVIDYGLWGRDERSALRQAAADLGAMVEMRYFELTPVEQRIRLDQRQAEAPHTTWPMSDEEVAEWAANIDIPTPGELDGTEPIDDPPAGFATWDEWRRHRWPLSAS